MLRYCFIKKCALILPKKSVIVHYGIDDYRGNDCVSTIGMFDGVHLGHGAMLRELKMISGKKKLPSVVVSFWPHPKCVLDNQKMMFLTTLSEKISIIEKYKIDHFVVMEFNDLLSKVTPRKFIEDVLLMKLKTRFLLMGYDHRFGSGVYSLEEYEKMVRSEGIEVKRLDKIDIDGCECSSSEIRKALNDDNLVKVNKILGYNYFIVGTVVSGDKIGRQIGFPTANIEVKDNGKILPNDGVYSSYLKCNDMIYESITNIGIRPTVGGSERRIETYILNFNADMYGKKVKIEFREKIRDEKKFNSIVDLRKAILEDIATMKDHNK